MATKQKLEKSVSNDALQLHTEIKESKSGEKSSKKGSKGLHKWRLFIGGPLILIGIVAFVLHYLGFWGGSAPEAKTEKTPIAEQLYDVFSYNLPSMLINLRTTGRRTSFLRVTISLEVKGKENKKEMDQLKPRIMDQFQTYLKELEVDDLQGSAGLKRLKEDLLARVNAVTAPIKVQSIRFGEFLVR
jgi:flagellar FliL protein